MVRLEAKRLRLAGMDPADIPRNGEVIRRSWHLTLPLIVMVSLLLMQYTPFLAAFWGILLTIAVSWIPLLLGRRGRQMAGTALTPSNLVAGFELGAKSAIGIGAACACVGFVLGIATLTGVGFKFSAFVLGLSSDLAAWIKAIDVFDWFDAKTLAILFGLIFTAIACIIMGAGVPTTPTYIILAAIVAPALAQLGVPLVATHFFVFFFGVLADVTPPVALAAFAAAGIARAEPMRTGFTAFRLSMAKAVVPIIFVFAPSLLFLNFQWGEFVVALAGSIMSIVALAIAYTGYFYRDVPRWMFLVLNLASMAMLFSDPLATSLASAVVIACLIWCRRTAKATA
ncbi:MAG: TRAP transporter large permease subunit [Anaerolineae bacterium]|nr:TRAP transporter large permease subunit [Anaerolineae bacterium]